MAIIIVSAAAVESVICYNVPPSHYNEVNTAIKEWVARRHYSCCYAILIMVYNGLKVRWQVRSMWAHMSSDRRDSSWRGELMACPDTGVWSADRWQLPGLWSPGHWLHHHHHYNHQQINPFQSMMKWNIECHFELSGHERVLACWLNMKRNYCTDLINFISIIRNLDLLLGVEANDSPRIQYVAVYTETCRYIKTDCRRIELKGLWLRNWYHGTK